MEIPRLRKGSCFPSFLEPRRTAAKALVAFAIVLGPCIDGSRGARALFGSGMWSVAAMHAASDLRHVGRAP